MGVTTGSGATLTTIGYITAFGTGTGGAGTYTLNTTPSANSSVSMTAGAFFIALYDNTPSFTAATTVYAPGVGNGEVSGTGYNTGSTTVPGGNVLSVSQVPTSSGTTAYINFSDTTWTGATITAYGALIYQNATLTIGGSSLIRPVSAVLDFGGAKSSSAANFTIQFPAAGASTAIIRIA
jgi:hypothetical protein